MPADAKLTLLPMPGPPVVRRVAPQEPPQQLERPGEMPAVSEKRTPSTEETPAPKETKSPAPEVAVAAPKVDPPGSVRATAVCFDCWRLLVRYRRPIDVD
jgi:hypothetical protein